jgi:putative phosphoribosyl transferase
VSSGAAAVIPPRFRDRVEAGRELAEALRDHVGPDSVVVGLPRGGVPVAFEVAVTLGAPLDVVVVRKLGFPGEEEWALGAITSGGVRVINPEAFARLGRGRRPPPDVRGRVAVVVDDGLHTGASMGAAVRALRQRGASRIVAGAPVGARAACDALRADADQVVCVITPEPFTSVGVWYRDFSETGDDDVRRLLAARRERP